MDENKNFTGPIDVSSWQGRTVVLATGARDMLPDIEGYAENWPNNIYHCLFCDGYERRKLPKGILCHPSFTPDRAEVATMAHFMCLPKGEPAMLPTPSSLRSKVTVFTNGPPNVDSDPAIQKALDVCAAHRMHIDTRPVLRLAADPEKPGVYVHLRNEDGSRSVTHMGFLVHTPPIVPAAPQLLSQLGVDLAPSGAFAVAHPPFHSTNVAGVFVAGDACTQMTHVTNAMYSGVMCAAGVAHYCIELDDQMAMKSFHDGKPQV
ncbi:hypothetical protein CLAIMM_10385 [Cladophialophora immunda]|nr:hypothetical protein CLAIMM_10385 [Cladophialophora immunda]